MIDVGSGRGKLACQLASRGFSVSGIEINPSYIAEAKDRAFKERVTVDFRQGEAEKLPYPDNFFDFANCAEVTEHVENPARVCQEIFRVLKPSGSCYISFHNRFGIYDYHYKMWGINWLPRTWAERFLNFIKKQKTDGAAGRQSLSTMHYFQYNQAISLLKGIGFSTEDARAVSIQKRFALFSGLFLGLYYIILRPLYFNSFHIRVIKSL